MPNHSAAPDPASLPPAGPPPAGPPPAGADGALVPRHRRLRLVLAMVGGILALLCLGGVGVVVALYDHATEIKRTEPDVVVDSFLRAYLVDRDDTQAALYECKSGADFAQLAAFRSDIVSHEKQYTIAIRVSWGSLAVTATGSRATVATDIHRTISDGSERTADAWHFDLVDQGGWRVCTAAPGP